MRFRGRVWKFGNDIDTDAIIPARYLNTHDPRELALHCMEDADADFAKKVQPGDIIVAGKNFGCGSSREHAPIAIKAAGVSCVIAASFARIFYRNAFNMGLPILECADLVEVVEDGEILSVDLSSGEIIRESTGQTFRAQPVPPFMQELIEAGGLIPYVVQKMKKEEEGVVS
ncbi:3-isopropylmalate dehydratase small subunit [Thermodesulforhabdus norvegica]|uniref:3-isopropylmalate dehydratase small subunit n=1 Tax=Thermodesulforhabdus norvegica TaxID=39841 RepID=A0A1I4RJR1_9BACT|nr:3-isopropylmalate dehydratase small subunit [Thermodesulforhabdus norvegica]SFM52501.1 3-isopropylmalate/(R)-2-methylmalate dehydratase small subunit [Thermodesulforhabdus norvegica]